VTLRRSRATRRIGAPVLLAGLVLALPTAQAWVPLLAPTPPGNFDKSTQGGGKIAADILPGTAGEFAVEDAQTPDGKIVVAATVNTTGTNFDFAVLRYNRKGTLDTTFSGDGITTTDFGGTETPSDIAVQKDGRIVVAGASSNDFALARYNTDGSLDPTFDGDGKVTTDFAGHAETGGGVAIQSDGKIVAAGGAAIGPGNSNFDVAFSRYNVNGSLDSSFSGDGKLTVPIGTAPRSDFARDVVLQPDGKLVAAGGARLNGTDFAFVRVNSGGTLDTSFDGDGIAVASVAPGTNVDLASRLARQPDGKLIAAGFAAMGTGNTNFDSAYVRLNTDGSLDRSFDGDGLLTRAAAPGTKNDFASDIEVQPSLVKPRGKRASSGAAAVNSFGLVTTGFGDDASDHAKCWLSRMRSDGTLDTRFNGGGMLFNPFAFQDVDDCDGVTVYDVHRFGRLIVIVGTGSFADGRQVIEVGYLIADEQTNSCLAISCRLIIGTSGNDEANGTPGRDVFDGEEGNDQFRGRGGSDFGFGGTGSDFFNGGPGDDYFTGGPGSDRAFGGEGVDFIGVLLGAGLAQDARRLARDLGLKPGEYKVEVGIDRYSGDGGADHLGGGPGNDWIFGGPGGDFIGSGGGPGNDRIHGGTGNDRIDGATGNDRLFGDGGNDLLKGGQGNDRLNGGRGKDRCAQGKGRGALISCERR
jgi:uncharacterized delta-60 repeat protein